MSKLVHMASAFRSDHMATVILRTLVLLHLLPRFYFLVHWWRSNSTLVSIVVQTVFPCGFYTFDLLCLVYGAVDTRIV